MTTTDDDITPSGTPLDPAPADVPEDVPGPGEPVPDAKREAIRLAHGMANVIQARVYVIKWRTHFFIADSRDLRIYHRAEIAKHNAHLVYIAYPMPPAFGWPDHEGWGAVPYGALAA